MASIGAFGAARAAAVAEVEPDTVEFFGREFRIANDSSAAVFFDYSEALVSELDLKDAQQAAAIKEMARDLVYAEDWPAFWAHYRAQRSPDPEEIVRELVRFIKDVSEWVQGRPTVRPTGSAAGPSSTGNGTSGTAGTGPTSEVWPVAVPVEAAFRPGPGEIPSPGGTAPGGLTASPHVTLSTPPTS